MNVCQIARTVLHQTLLHDLFDSYTSETSSRLIPFPMPAPLMDGDLGQLLRVASETLDYVYR